jgi:hypothetical protein
MQPRMASRAAFAWANSALQTMQARRVSAAARVRTAYRICYIDAADRDGTDAAAPPAAVSETHLDDDAAPSLERLLPSDFAVPVYFICGERCLPPLPAATLAWRVSLPSGTVWDSKRRMQRAHWAGAILRGLV